MTPEQENFTRNVDDLKKEVGELKIWKSVFNSLDDALVIINSDLIIEDINNKGLSIFKVEKKQAIGKRCHEFLFNRKTPCAYCPNHMSFIDIKDIKYVEKYNDRVNKHFSVKSSSIHDENGNVIKTVDLIRDITEKKETEILLKESERKFKSFISNSIDGIVLTDFSGKIIEWNEGQENLTQIKREDAINKNIWDINAKLMPNDQKPRVFINAMKNKMASMFDGSQTMWKGNRFETKVQLPDGTIAHHDSIVFPIKTDKGKIAGSITRDVTNSKLAESTIKDQQEDLKLLASTALDFVDEILDDRIFDYICDTLESILGKGTYFVNSYDKNTKKFTLQAVIWHAKLSNKIAKFFDGKIVGFEAEATDMAVFPMLETGKLTPIPGGFHEYTFKQVPKNIALAIEKLLNIKDIYVIGLSIKGEILGSVGVLLPMDRKIEKASLVEAFIKQASMALHRKLMQDRLRYDETRFRSLYENAPIGIFRTDENGKIILSNSALNFMIGFDESEKIYKKDFVELGIEIERKWKAFIMLLTETEDVKGFETEWKTKNGDVILVELNGKALRNEFNEIKSFECTVEDITTRKKYEDDLRASEQRFKDLNQLLPEIVFEVDLEGKIMYLNQLGYDLFGVTKDEINEGFFYADIVAPEDKEKIQERFQKIVFEKKIGASEYKFLSRENGLIPVLVHSNVIERDGKTVGLRGIVIDLRDIRKAEDTIVRNEERFRALIQNSSDIIAVVDSNLNVDIQFPLNKYSVDFDKGIDEVLKLIDPDDLKNCTNIIKSIINDNISNAEFEFKIKNKNDEWEICESIASNQIENSAINGVIINTRIITDRKKKDEQLKESEKRFKDLAELLPQTVYELDLFGNFTFVNQMGLEMFGYTKKEFDKGVNISDILDEKEFERFKERFTQGIETGSIGKVEYTFRRKDGSTFPGYVYANVDMVDGKPVGVKGILIDSSEQNNMLKQQRKFYANQQFLGFIALNYLRLSYEDNIFSFIGNGVLSLIDNAIIIINEYDKTSKCFKPQKILGANQFMPKVSEIIGEDLYNLSFPVTDTMMKDNLLVKLIDYDLNSLSENFRKLTKKSVNLLTKLINLNKIYIIGLANNKELLGNITIITTGDVVVEDKRVFEVFAYQASIGLHRRKIESELIKAKEHAEESDKLKSAFLANMSHEIRTPMNGIVGFGELLLKKNDDPVKREKYIKIINENSKYLLNIINDIIDISKLQSGQLLMYMEDFSLNELMSELFAFFTLNKFNNGKDNIELILKNGLDDDNCSIYSDILRVKQVLMNLLSNAVKFTKEGKVEFGYELIEKDNKIKFFVKDTGIGLPKDKLEFVFGRFVQADFSTTRKYGGSGLGLSISKGIVNLLGGEIWANSEEKVGSEFIFTIPYIKASTNKVSNKIIPEKESSFKGKKVLLIEDDEKSLTLYKEIFGDLELEALYSSNGNNAINLFKNNEDIDMVLVDIQLPDIDGYEVTKRIKKINSKIPVIAQTANAMVSDRNKALSAGCDDVLYKPVVINKLTEMIEKYIN